MLRHCRWLLSLLLALASAATQADDLKPYPPAAPGFQRLVIRLPEVAQPDERKVELLFSRSMEIDCNRHSIGGHLVSKIAEGWGYPYLVLEKLGPGIATRMACPPDQPLRRAAVPIRSQPAELAWVRYNPKLPIVVYVPDGVELRYRIWSAGAETPAVNQ